MKKVMKAAIAAGAAGALLLGGAGTFALWNDTEEVNAGTVTTGSLTLDTTAAGVWTDTTAGATTTNFDPAVDHIVPGDTLTYTQAVTIGADGKNLKGTLTVGTLNAVPTALEGQVSVVVAPTAVAGVTLEGDVVSFAAPGSYTVPVTITVSFAAGSTGTTPGTTMEQPIVLNALELTLNQVL